MGLSLDRIHIERTHPFLIDLIAFCGGFALAAYVAFYVAVYIYQ